MHARFLCVCLLAALTGCGQSPPSPAESSADPGSLESAPPAETEDDTQLATTLTELTQAVRKFSVEQRRVPKSLDEVVAAGYLSQLPPAPAGKRFAIDKNLQVYVAE